MSRNEKIEEILKSMALKKTEQVDEARKSLLDASDIEIDEAYAHKDEIAEYIKDFRDLADFDIDFEELFRGIAT